MGLDIRYLAVTQIDLYQEWQWLIDCEILELDILCPERVIYLGDAELKLLVLDSWNTAAKDIIILLILSHISAFIRSD